MKRLDSMDEINQASDLVELIINNYIPEARLALCATVIESVAFDMHKSIGEVYDTMKGAAEILWKQFD